MCAGAPYSITVTVNPAPIVTNLPTASTCSGTGPNISLGASVPSNFTWNVGAVTGGISGASNGSGAVINQVLTNPSNLVAGTVAYIVTPTATTGSCAGIPFTITVTVYPAPVVTNLPTAITCSGTGPNIGLNASVPSSFTWTLGTITGSITGASAGSGSSINQVLTNPSNSASGSVEYVVTPTSTIGNCTGAPYTITVTVDPIPSITTANTKTICSGTGANISLTASAPGTFAWTIGTITGGITGASASSGNTINQILTNPSPTTSGTVQYVVTPTTISGLCTGTPYTITVTVNPAPIVTNPITYATCSGSGPNIALTASTASTFTWTIGAITGSITGASPGSGALINQLLTNPSNSVTGSVQYIVTPTAIAGVCAGNPLTITVNVYPTPVVTNPATATTCSGTGPNINLTASFPSNFNWTIGTITGSITGASAGSGPIINQVLTNPSNAASGTIQYNVTPTAVLGTCTGATFTITVTVNPAPVVTNVNPAPICSGTAPTINLTATVPSTFAWTVGTITGGITGASSGAGPTINQVLTSSVSPTGGTVQYLVTPTSIAGGCPGVPFPITVTVTPTPVLTNLSPVNICSATGTNIVLTASAPSSFTWSLGAVTGGITGALAGVGGTINQVLINPSNISVGTVGYIVTPTATTGSCPGAPTTITAIVNPVPAVTTPSTATICSTASPNIALTATTPSTFTWIIGAVTGGITGASSGSGTTINQILTNPNPASSGTVAYVVTPTSVVGACAGAPYTITVTVNPSPVLTSPNTQNICSGTAPGMVLAASDPASTFSWTIGTITGGITGASTGSGPIINQTLTNPSNLTTGTVQYLVTPNSPTNGSCAVFPVTITVFPSPLVTSPATAITCSGSSPNIPLAASVPSNFTWTIGTITGGISGALGGSGNAINQVLTNPSNFAAGTVEYRVTPTSTTNLCAGTPFSIVVTVNPAPVVTTVNTKTICSGLNANIALLSSAPSTFAWTIGAITGGITGASNGSGSTISQILTNPSSTVAGTVQYIVTPTAITGSCVGTTYTITVTVDPAPLVTTVDPAPICSGTSPNIALAASVPSTFTWTVGTITGGITGATGGTGATINQILTNPSNSLTGTVEYIVTPTAVTGSCPGISKTIVVTVNPIPVMTLLPTAAICSGTATNIVLTASVPCTYSWTLGAITGGVTGASAGSGSSINQTLTYPGNASAGTVNYIVTPTSVAGSCSGAPFVITVSVNATPDVTTPNTATICSGTGTNIPLTASAPSIFTWTIGSITGGITGAFGDIGPNINQTLVNPSSTTAGTVEYFVTPTSVTGTCVGTPYTITVTVNPAPIITTTNPAPICSGTSPNIALVSSSPSSISWTVGAITGGITGATGGVGATINQILTNPSNTAAGSVEYIVTPTAIAGSCAGISKSIFVTVNPKPIMTNPPTAAICSGTATNIVLSASVPCTFSWTLGAISGGVTGASAGTGSSINQILNYPGNASAGTVNYIVTPTSVAGACVGTPFVISVSVNAIPDVTTVNTATICSGTSTNIPLIASSPSNFSWTIGTITGGITGATADIGATINQTLTNPSSSASGTVEYIVTPTSTTGLCLGLPYTITVTVNPAPIVMNTNPAPICSGTSPNIALVSSVAGSFTWTIGAITNGITGASAGLGSTINQILTNPSNSLPGVVEYIVTPTATTGSCAGISKSIFVTVNPKPIVTNAPIDAICSGASTNIVLTASVPSTFAWTLGTVSGGVTGASAGSGPSIIQTLTYPGNASAGTVNYIVTPTSVAGSCAGTPFTITVSVNATPDVTTPATATICSGSTTNIPLTASAPSTFIWTVGSINGGVTGASAGSGTAITQTLINPSSSLPGTVEYLVTPTSTSGSCTGIPFSITVTVNPVPVVTTPATSTICSGTSPNINLTASTPSTFTWTVGTITGSISGANPGSGSTINQTLTNPSSVTIGSVIYVVTPTDIAGTCSGNPYNITVTVYPKPLVTNAATLSICSGTSPNIALTTSTPSTFTWTVGTITGSISGASAGSGSTINQILTNPSTTVSGTVAYVVTPTSIAGSCIGAPFTITVTVNPAPVITSANTANICSGGSTNIGLIASAPSSFSWTIGANIGGITGASGGTGAVIAQTLINPSNAVGSIEYIVTPTLLSSSCPGVPYSITVTVNPAPVLTNPNTAAVCSGSSPNIALTSSVPASFSWVVGTITGGITGASAGVGPNINQVLTNPSNSAAGTVAYIVTPTATTGSCSGAPYTIIVTVYPNPIVTNAPTAVICNGTSPNIALTASTPSSFTWTVGTITGSVTGASAGSGLTINQTLTNPSNTVAGTVAYIVTPTSLAGTCTGASFTITVTVSPAPIVTSTNTATICSGSTTNIPLTASLASSFTWTIGTNMGGITGASGGSGLNISQVLVNPSNVLGSVEYLVTPTSLAGSCTGAPFSITVMVNPAPVVTTPPTTTICNGTSTGINLTSSVPATFIWAVGTITGGITGATIGSGNTINQVLNNPSSTISGTVQYIVTPTATVGGCVGNPYTITVTVLPKPVVTNAPTGSTCSGSSPNIALTSSVPCTFTWTVGAVTGGILGASVGTGPIINQVLTNPSNSTPGTVAYIVTPTSTAGSCAGVPYTITVTVNPAPLVTTANTATICSGTSTGIALTATVPSTFTWTIGTISGSITGAGAGSGSTISQTLVNPSTTVAGTVEYLVTPTATTGSCAGAPYLITVTVNPSPVVTNANTATVCSGTGPGIGLTASVPSSFTWTIGAITGGITGASAGAGATINQSLTNPSNSVAGTIAYIVTPTATTGTCAGTPYTIIVTVLPKPVVTNPAVARMCSGSGSNINLTASVPSTFAWTVSTITGGITGASVGTGSLLNQVLTNPSTTLSGTVNYIVTPTSVAGSCVGSPYTIMVTVDPAPVVTTPNTASICSGTSPGINLTASVASSFTWTIGTITGGITGASAGLGPTINQTLINPSGLSAGTVDYIVTPTSLSGTCAGAPYTITVTVDPAPAVTTPAAATICSGTGPGINLTASVASTYTWTVGPR